MTRLAFVKGVGVWRDSPGDGVIAQVLPVLAVISWIRDSRVGVTWHRASVQRAAVLSQFLDRMVRSRKRHIRPGIRQKRIAVALNRCLP